MIGEEGNGKSTLLNLIQGLITGDCGRILLDGKDIMSVAQEERQVNIVSGILTLCGIGAYIKISHIL